MKMNEVERTLADAIKYYILLSLQKKPMTVKEISANCSANRDEIGIGIKDLLKEGKIEMIKIGNKYPYALKKK